MSTGSDRNIRLLEFFKAIWPSVGMYCIALKTERGMHQQFFPTMEQAAAFALAADDRGCEVYHACASYKDGSSRKGENVAAVKCFWMDIDVGEDKPYGDPRTAYDACRNFVAAADLPDPSYVFSGSGWHLYWSLQREISAEDWRARSDALKRRTDELGLAADTKRTGDVASILRPPGTHNRKRGEPVAVRAALTGSYHDVERFPAGFGVTSQQVNGQNNEKFQVPFTGPEEPAYGELVARDCAQVRSFRDRKGQLPEPEWYAGLCVLAHCADGEKLAHAWSAGDPRYNYNDTQRKLEHGRQASGPTTCAHFQRLNSAACMGCSHAGKITSPIQLGRNAAPVAPVGSVTLPKLRFPFRWGQSNALEIRIDDRDANTFTFESVYKAPIFVSHVRKHEHAGGVSVALQHWLPYEGWQEALLPWDDHSPKVVLNRLGSQGINVHGPHAKHMLPFLHAAIDDFQNSGKTEMEYAQFGWKGEFESFLLGHELFEPGKAPRMVGLTPELAAKAQGMKPFGSFEHWRAAANHLFAFERQGIMVLAGFAAVLMRFAQESGGLILAAVSEEGGKGKTLGLRGAQTAWGAESVTAISKTDTANSRFKLISLLGGLPITWDEMRDRDPEIVKDFVLNFSGGRDKNRLDKNAALRQAAQTWSTMLIATSNVSVAELVSHDGETAQQARIMEAIFEDLTGVQASDGKEIERALLANRGHAGRRFIQALMIPGMIDWLKHAIPNYAREYENALGRHNTVLRFYTNGLACLRAAAEIVNRAEILEFSTQRLMEYALSVAGGMGGKLQDPRNDHVGILSQFINQNWPNALVVREAWRPNTSVVPQQVPRGVLAMRYESENHKVYIDRSFLKDWCAKKRIMYGHLCSRLKEAGVLVNDAKKINLGSGTTFAAAGQVMAWEIRGIAAMGVEVPDHVVQGDNVVRIH